MTSWQDSLYDSLVQRDGHEKAFNDVIEQYRRLAQQAAILKARNQSLLKAAASVRETSGSSTSGPADSAVARAYTQSLELQLSNLREELATLYRTQGQNAQRLLEMNETLRERDDHSKVEQDELRQLRIDTARLRERVANHAEVMREKERNVQIVQDELATLQLEFTQLEQRSENLKKDNASLLQRWLDRLNVEASRMNDANTFLNEVEKKGLPMAEESL